MEKKYTIEKTDAEWQAELDASKYRILRQKGTEQAYSGEYYLHEEKGIYACGGCGQELFLSDGKYHSGCGWPSFYEAAKEENIEKVMDTSHGMRRTEIMCSNCGSHLGHVFPDGPADKTGLRYCVNSLSLDFKKAEE